MTENHIPDGRATTAPNTTKKWGRRLMYLVIFIVWLLLMAFPFVAFTLATNGEMRIGNERHLRLFLVQEAEANGIGIEWRRSLFQPGNCLRTSVAFLMWEGESEGVSYCQCFDPATNEPLPVVGNACTE
jgi:hypothetical protein